MCRILKVALVAPSGEHLELRRALSSLEYEIIASVESAGEVPAGTDVALLVDAAPGAAESLRSRNVKVVTAGEGDGDLCLARHDVRAFKSRVWELFRA